MCFTSGWLPSHPPLTLQKRTRLWISSSAPSPLRLSSRRPRGAERWCGEAISHIQFTYGCHKAPPDWVVMSSVRGALDGHPVHGKTSLCHGGQTTFSWWELHRHFCDMINVGLHFLCVSVQAVKSVPVLSLWLQCSVSNYSNLEWRRAESLLQSLNENNLNFS